MVTAAQLAVEQLSLPLLVGKFDYIRSNTMACYTNQSHHLICVVSSIKWAEYIIMQQCLLKENSVITVKYLYNIIHGGLHCNKHHFLWQGKYYGKSVYMAIFNV